MRIAVIFVKRQKEAGGGAMTYAWRRRTCSVYVCFC